VRRAGPLGLLAFVTLAAASCGRCGGGAATVATAGPRAVAVVNGEPIPAEALARELRQIRAGVEGEAPGEALRKRVLDDLVDRALLLQQARARSIAVGQDQVERAFLRVRGEYPGTHFDDLLARERLSQAELKARLKDQLTVERLFHDEVFPRLTVAPADVEKWYAEHPAEFGEPERVRVVQVVVSSRDEAITLRDKLRREPARFAEVARASSIAPEGKNGGELGWIGRGGGFPEVFDVCFSMPLNSVSDVVPSPYGFHLFRVLERKAASKRTLDQARGEVGERLLRDRRARAQEEYLAALRGRATIQVDQSALTAVTP
jgi:peptidyl-prolyl cis-trans isomerase C